MFEMITNLISGKSDESNEEVQNVLVLLEKDHQVLRALLRELDDLKESKGQKVKEVLKKFNAELVAHSRAEEKSFYEPFIEKNKEAEIHVLEGFEEHMLVDTISNKLLEAEPGSPSYQARLKVVQELLEHHLKDEEKEHFPLAAKKFSSTELAEMGKRYLELKKSPKKGTVKKNLKTAKARKAAKKPSKKTVAKKKVSAVKNKMAGRKKTNKK